MKKVLIFICLILLCLSFNVNAKKNVECENNICNLVEESDTYDVPVLGKVDAKKVSLPLLSIIMGFVDGFNPCAMWILIFLISMLIGMKDKKRLIILGSIFILTSGVIYFLFMASWLSLATFLSKIVLIRLFIAFFSIIIGMYNIYRFIKLENSNDEVGCDVTDSKSRKNIINRVKKIVKEKSFLLSIIGIILLAASVNILELLCSLGLPVIYTEILTINNLSIIESFIYMLIYILFFLIDDIAIFLIAVFSLKIKSISNKYTKYSHLIGGIIMLVLGLLMLLKPEILM